MDEVAGGVREGLRGAVFPVVVAVGVGGAVVQGVLERVDSGAAVERLRGDASFAVIGVRLAGVGSDRAGIGDAVQVAARRDILVRQEPIVLAGVEDEADHAGGRVVAVVGGVLRDPGLGLAVVDLALPRLEVAGLGALARRGEVVDRQLGHVASRVRGGQLAGEGHRGDLAVGVIGELVVLRPVGLRDAADRSRGDAVAAELR